MEKKERKPRKKLSEMTPFERVDQRMKGMTWEEAEEVGVEILARCFALHQFSRKDGIEYFENVSKRIIERGFSWAREGGNAAILAFASMAHRDELKKKKQ